MKKEIINRLRNLRDKEKLNLSDIIFLIECKQIDNNIINGLVNDIIDIFTYNLYSKADFFNSISLADLILAKLSNDNLFDNLKKYYKGNIDNIVNDIINI